MKVKELKDYGITREKIDNGYRVEPSYRYTYNGHFGKPNFDLVVDKVCSYGTKYYVVSIKDEVMTNFLGKMLRWENLEDLQDDILRIFTGCFPNKFYTSIA